MQMTPLIHCSHARCRGRFAFSLVEVMIVLVVIGAMIAMSAPSYRRTVEQSRADIAAANLRAIWSAERVYWLEYHAYANVTQLQDLKLLDPEVLNSLSGGNAIGGYTYSVNVPSDGSDFTATAQRAGGMSVFQIDRDGTFAVTGGTLTPGFQ
jgi:prepilin-type N-terminal cleavage/methylation domain-containing protein